MAVEAPNPNHAGTAAHAAGLHTSSTSGEAPAPTIGSPVHPSRPFTHLAHFRLDLERTNLTATMRALNLWRDMGGSRVAHRRTKYELPAAEAAVEQARRRVEDAERDLAMIAEAEAR